MLPTRTGHLQAPADWAAGSAGAPASSGAGRAPLRAAGGGGGERDAVVQLGADAPWGPTAREALHGFGLYGPTGRMAGPDLGLDARLRETLGDLGLTHGEIEDVVAVAKVVEELSPRAARQLEEGLRALADEAAELGPRPAASERLGDRPGYALDYLRLEFHYTEVGGTDGQGVGADGDGAAGRPVTQIDVTFERLEVALRDRDGGPGPSLALDRRGYELVRGGRGPAGDDVRALAAPVGLLEALVEHIEALREALIQSGDDRPTLLDLRTPEGDAPSGPGEQGRAALVIQA